MGDYDTQIVITSVLKFTNKKNEPMCKLDLLLTDPKLCKNNEKFVGCTPVTQWYDGHEVFDYITKNDLILKGVMGHFASHQDYKDPTKFSSKLETVKHKDNVITLLQSN